MLRAYFRLILFVLAIAGAAILFAFAFSAAAVVVFVTFVVLALFGRPPQVDWWTVHQEQRRQDDENRRPPLTIDHDPNDLPPDRDEPPK
jgi:hypothetical protein